jgi:diaminopropionate ammonia-lyase
MNNRYFINLNAREGMQPGLFAAEEYSQVAEFYDRRLLIKPTPLRRLPALAAWLGISELLLKDETERCGLPAFKITGVAFTIDRLISSGRLASDSVLVAATAGNHGRALARAARERNLRARIHVPFDAAPARVAAIQGEGAEVISSSGNYDCAVRQAADEAAANGWVVVSDTAWPGYEQIPRWIKAGYTRVIMEAARQWTAETNPDLVLVQGGVGGLVCATLSWLCWRDGNDRPRFIVCEPVGSACLLAAAQAGHPVRLADPPATLMECLRCGEASSIALPVITAAADAFVAIDDEWCAQAMRRLARPEAGDPAIAAGASGACGVGSLLAMMKDDELRGVREFCGLGPDARVLAVVTEGVTDPELYARVVGES